MCTIIIFEFNNVQYCYKNPAKIADMMKEILRKYFLKYIMNEILNIPYRFGHLYKTSKNMRHVKNFLTIQFFLASYDCVGYDLFT